MGAERVARTLASVKGMLDKRFGDGTVADCSAAADLMAGRVRQWLPTGLPGMDAVLGRQELGKDPFGMPLGRLVEIYGAEGQGKSSLAYYLLGAAQAAGGAGILVDTEESFDSGWAEQLGVNTKDLVLLPFNEDSSLEKYFDILEEAALRLRRADKNAPVLAVVDTVVCCRTQEQLERRSYRDTGRLNALPRALSQHLPSLCAFAARHRVGLVFVNQIRQTLALYGEKERSPGGWALRHMAAVRVVVHRIAKNGGGVIESEVSNVKNKLAVPFRQAFIQISPNGLCGMVRSKK